jgi:hypothetical protein
MRDEVGKMLPKGIAIGFESGMPSLERDIEKQLDNLMAGIDYNINSSYQAILKDRTGSSGSILDNVKIVVDTYLDGRLVAESTTPHSNRINGNMLRQRERGLAL